MRAYTNTTFGIACAVMLAGLLYYGIQAALIATAMEPSKYDEVREKRSELLRLQEPPKYSSPEAINAQVWALMDQERDE